MKAHFCANQMFKLKTVQRQIDRMSAEKNSYNFETKICGQTANLPLIHMLTAKP